jgi:hypothetical protein
VLIFPAHTTNLFQALDFVFFGVLKHLKTPAAGDFHDDNVNNQITTIIQAYEQTITSSTIQGSFRRAGIGMDVTICPFTSNVDKETVRPIPGFQAI